MADISKLKYKKKLMATALMPDDKGRMLKFVQLKPGSVFKHQLPPIPGTYTAGITIRVELGNPLAYLEEQYDFMRKVYKLKKLPDFPFFSVVSAQWKFVVTEDYKVEILTGAKLHDKKEKLYSSQGLDVGLGIPFVKGSSLEIDLISTADSNQSVIFKPSKSNSAVSMNVLARHDKHVLYNETFAIQFVAPKPPKKMVPKEQPKPKISFKKVPLIVVGPFSTGSDKIERLDKKANVPGAWDSKKLTRFIKGLSKETLDMYRSGNRPAGYSNIIIKGYADTRGDESMNRGLGMNRAKAVKKYIKDDLGAAEGYYSALTEGEGPKPNKDGQKGQDNAKARIVTIEMLVVK